MKTSFWILGILAVVATGAFFSLQKVVVAPGGSSSKETAVAALATPPKTADVSAAPAPVQNNEIPIKENPAAKNYDAFARCLGESGAKFYGASWCSHCQAQKSEFGDSAKLLPYTECAVADARTGQAEACRTAGVHAYPTWRFSDGTEKEGKLGLDELAQKTGCSLP